MHTHEGSEGTRFFYNSDLSGDVTIIRGDEEMRVPGEDLLGFVLNDWARRRLMSWAQDVDLVQLLRELSK